MRTPPSRVLKYATSLREFELKNDFVSRPFSVVGQENVDTNRLFYAYPTNTVQKYRLERYSAIPNPYWSGAVAAHAPTSWWVAGNDEEAATLVPSQTVNGNVCGVMQVRQTAISAGTYSGVGTVGTFNVDWPYRVSIWLRVPTGITAQRCIHWDTNNGEVEWASATALNAQAKDTWVNYTRDWTPTARVTELNFMCGGGAIGDGFDMAMPTIIDGYGNHTPVLTSQKNSYDYGERMVFKPVTGFSNGDIVGMFQTYGNYPASLQLPRLFARAALPLANPTYDYLFACGQGTPPNLYVTITRRVNSVATEIARSSPIAMDITKAYYMRANLNGSTLSVKHWPWDDTEPSWQAQVTDTALSNGVVGGVVSDSVTDAQKTWIKWFAVSLDPAVPAPLYQKG